LNELFQLADGESIALSNSARFLNEHAQKLCAASGDALYRIFEDHSRQYLLLDEYRARGEVSPELREALAVVSERLRLAKQLLDAPLFTNYLLPAVARQVDSKVYAMIRRTKISLTAPNMFTQFDLDLRAMEEVFGSDELRKLASVRYLVTQSGPRNFDVEVPPDDLELFIRRVTE
jgi:hypothetical protein